MVSLSNIYTVIEHQVGRVIATVALNTITLIVCFTLCTCNKDKLSQCGDLCLDSATGECLTILITGHERPLKSNQFDSLPTRQFEIIKESSELAESDFDGVEISEGKILTPTPHRKIEVKKSDRNHTNIRGPKRLSAFSRFFRSNTFRW